MKLTAQPFKPRDKVDCWPDYREIETRFAADIAVHYVAQVQCYAELDLRLPCRAAFGVDPGHCGACLRRRGQGGGANGLGVAINWEDGEHRVADELKRVSAILCTGEP